MSVYIKGMEMPTTCFECPFMFTRRYCCANLTLDLYQGDYEEIKGRVDGCPLVPVPEHGDLIDTRPFDIIGFHNPEPGYNDTFMDGVRWMEDKIDNAPVVIPADPEEEEDE